MKSASIKRLPKSLVLIGLMGVGKSTIGQALAQCLGVDFIDSDTAIEAEAQMPISSIFAQYGEDRFRVLEASVFEQILARPPAVIASGGGAFINPDIRRRIGDSAISLWLRATPETLAGRIGSASDSRPLLDGTDTLATLTQLAETRYPIYAQADSIIDTDGLSLEAVLELVHNRVIGVLQQP